MTHSKRLLVAMLAVTVCVPGPALAFQGDEHATVSNWALNLALKHTSVDESLRNDLVDSFLGETATKEGRTFGDFTRAVDWYRHPEKLVCISLDCVDAKDRASASSDTHVVYPELLENSAKAVVDRSQQWLRPLLAAHQNRAHFAHDAAQRYNYFHDRAIKQARAAGTISAEQRTAAYVLALETEAVALHFLQDFFAPGHMMTRRTAFEDLGSRSLHNRFNKSKVIQGTAPQLKTLDDLRGSFVTMAALPLESLPNALRTNADSMTAVAKVKSPADTLPMRGDGRLMQDATGVQRLALLLISATSVQQVLTSGSGATRIALCHRPWTAEAQATDWDNPELWSACPPWGAAVMIESASITDENLGQVSETCWESRMSATGAPVPTGDYLLGYPQLECPNAECQSEVKKHAEGKLRETVAHRTFGFTLALLGGPGREGSFPDVGFTLLSVGNGEIGRREECEYCDGDFDDGFASGLFYVGYARSELEHGLVSHSYQGGLQLHLKPVSRHAFNMYVAPLVSVDEFESPTRPSTIKPGGSLRFGLGVAYFFAEAGAQVTHEEEPTGHLATKVRPIIGFRAQYSF